MEEYYIHFHNLDMSVKEILKETLWNDNIMNESDYEEEID